VDRVFCLDASTGKERRRHAYECTSCWTQDVKFDGPRSTPTVDGDRVFTLNLEGHLFCLDTETGRVVWSKRLTQDMGGRIPVYGYCCSPLVYRDLLILELNAPGAPIVALQKQTGEIVWRCETGEITCGSPVLTRLGDIDCAIISGGGKIVGVNAATGELLWQHRTWGYAWMGPVVSGNYIFMANACSATTRSREDCFGNRGWEPLPRLQATTTKNPRSSSPPPRPSPTGDGSTRFSVTARSCV
jgi:outer membrane protein assembly factor BamB